MGKRQIVILSWRNLGILGSVWVTIYLYNSYLSKDSRHLLENEHCGCGKKGRLQRNITLTQITLGSVDGYMRKK